MITVVADDITGAAEIAGVCLRHNLTVAFGIDSVPCVKADVRVVATDSRSMSEVAAYSAHRHLAIELQSGSSSFIFKKCDSVLRGYVVSELVALMEVFQQKKAVLQPSNPAAGRCITNGKYYIEGELIEKSGFNIDPDFPAFNSEVVELLKSRSILFGDTRDIIVNRDHSESDGIYIRDCNSVEALKEVASDFDSQKIYAGSAAFFEQIIGLLYPQNSTLLKPTKEVSSNYLLIGGTTHPQSKRYLQSLQKRGCPLIYFPKNLLTEEYEEFALNDFANQLMTVWQENNKLALSISSEKIIFPNSSKTLKLRLNKTIAKLLISCNINDIMLEGGATAYSLLELLNWDTLIPVQELSPGVVRMQVANRPSLFITLKPGSYPWPERLIHEE